jgi:hypothetical protein
VFPFTPKFVAAHFQDLCIQALLTRKGFALIPVKSQNAFEELNIGDAQEGFKQPCPRRANASQVKPGFYDTIVFVCLSAR